MYEWCPSQHRAGLGSPAVCVSTPLQCCLGLELTLHQERDLKLRHSTQRGGSMVNLKEEDPGASPQLVCSDCNAPWGQFSKCLLCQGSQPVDLSVTPLSVIEVAGQSWQLRLTEAGPTWVPTDTKVTKASGLVEVGDLGRPPPAAASGAGMGLVSFSEQVPASQRLTLQQQRPLGRMRSFTRMEHALPLWLTETLLKRR